MQALGNPAAAQASLARAADAFAALAIPFDAARARLEWATLAAAHDPEAAAQAARESLAAFEQLGARRYAGRARRLLRALGMHVATSRGARPRGGPLSAREMEVAGLVAAGLSNAEIAARLVVSPRTVTTHLEHIYQRLGITSRAALTRYVVEAGLVSPPGEHT